MSGGGDEGGAVLAKARAGRPVAVASGTFTIDREKARDKLRHFQLADPCAWLLEAMRAAVVQGATRIEIEADSDDVHVRFDGRPFQEADLAEIHAALLARRAPAGRQHLSAALNGAMALEPRFLRVESLGSPESLVRLEMRPGKPDTLEQMKAQALSSDGAATVTRIHMREPFRVGRFVEAFRVLLGTKREIQAARSGGRFSPIPVFVNGERASLADVPARARADLLGRSAAGSVLLDASEPEATGSIVLLHHGIVLEKLEHPWLPQGVGAVVEAKALTRDASLASFVRGPTFDALIDEVLVAALALVEGQGDDENLRRGASAFLAASLEAARGTSATRFPRLSAALGKRGRPTRRVPLFRDHEEAPLCVNDIVDEIQEQGSIAYVHRRGKGLRPARRLLLVPEEDMPPLRIALGDRQLVDGEPVLRAAETDARHRKRLEKRRAPTALPPIVYVTRHRFEKRANEPAAASGEIGLRATEPVGLVVTFFTDGCLIANKVLPCPLSGLQLALEGSFWLNATYDDVVVDEVYADALFRAWCEIPALFEAAVSAYESEEYPGARAKLGATLREHGAAFLAWGLDGPGLWAAFAKQNKIEDFRPARALTKVSLDGKNPHPIVRAPLLRTVDGNFVSLEELPERVAVVPPDVVRCSRGDAIRAGPVLRKVIACFRPLEVLDEVARREHRRAALLERPPDDRARPRGTAVELRHGGVTGRLALGSAPALVLEVYLQRRLVDGVKIPWCPVGPLHAVVDDPELLPLANGRVPPPALPALVEAALHGVPALLHEARFELEWRKLALSVLGALFPDEILRRAVGALEAGAEGTEAGAAAAEESLALLELAAAVGVSDVVSTIELLLEAGERPTVEAVRRFAETAGTAIPPAVEVPALVAGRSGVAALGGAERLLGGAPTLMERALLAAPALEGLLFRRLDGETVRLRALVDIVRAGGRVRFVRREVAGAAEGEDVLVLERDEARALRRFLGALDDVTREVRAAIARRRFEARAPEHAALEPAGHATVVDIVDGAVRGQVGLIAPAAGQTRATIRILRDGRFVQQQDVSASTPCSFSAVIDDPSLPMRADWSASSAPARVSRLVALCIRAAEAGVDRLAALDPVPPAARLCLLERAARLRVVPLTEPRRARLFEAPVLTSATRAPLSLASAIEGSQGGRIRFIASPVADPPAGAATVVLIEGAVERALLADIGGGQPLEMTALWAKAERARRRRAALSPLPSPPHDALVVRTLATEDGRVTAWVPLSIGDTPTLWVGAGGLAVHHERLQTIVPGLVVVVEGDALVDEEWSGVRMPRVRGNLEGVSAIVMEELVRLVAAGAPGDGDREELVDLRRRTCEVVLLALLGGSQRDFGPRWGALQESLEALPLFEVDSGARISWLEMLTHRPRAYEGLLRRLATAGALADIDSVAVGLDDVEVAPSGASEAEEEARAPPAERVLEERLRETLSLVQLDGAAAAELARWPISVEKRGGEGPVVDFTRKATCIDADHPFVRRALAGLEAGAEREEDAAAFFMLCAVVYGAVNAHLEEITDDHERDFLARLMKHALTARS
jgi:hypothetical protein